MEVENSYERVEYLWTCSTAGASFGILLTFSIIIKSVLTFHYFKYTEIEQLLCSAARIQDVPIVSRQIEVRVGYTVG